MSLHVWEFVKRQLLESKPGSDNGGWLIGTGRRIIGVIQRDRGLEYDEVYNCIPGGLYTVGSYSCKDANSVPKCKDMKSPIVCIVKSDRKTLSFFQDGQQLECTYEEDCCLDNYLHIRTCFLRETEVQRIQFDCKRYRDQILKAAFMYDIQRNVFFFSEEEWITFVKSSSAIKRKGLDVLGPRIVHEVLLGNSTADPSSAAPTISIANQKKNPKKVQMRIDASILISKETSLKESLKILIDKISSQFIGLEKAFMSKSSPCSLSWATFRPSGIPYPICMMVPASVDAPGNMDSKLLTLRKKFHIALQLPLDKPLLRLRNVVPFGVIEKEGADKLMNVHRNVKHSGVKGGKVFTVDGDYLYCHYMQDSFDDKGWGCAYRTFQTICSWLQLQGYTNLQIPSHREIQEALVACEDNQKTSLIGSKQWIGAIELQMVLKYRYGIEARVLHVTSGADINTKARFLAKHFETEGTPVMIGGGYLAYGLVGIDWNEATGECKYLILDPHYTGNENITKIIKDGWCGW
eukprot:CAMPEP_0184481226 /NCGR_PEP_ID=MMETSP0113_2-20130426/2770_1 /TAXON_ID=91329 /ORGANISM="Norrisiella sphaerica, Strain BC52" /LENGTH=519 /DNA_ID=CAMNT_0026860217 /DNA_START=126 /DNA_END=1682 /DNA_ORIENTATION=-